VKRRLVPLRAALSDAVDNGLIASNPAAGVRVLAKEQIEEDEDRLRALSREQVGALLAAVDPQHRLLIRFAAETGCRVSEIIGLQWRDVTLGNVPVINIRRAVVKGRVGPPKSRHGRRTIPLSAGMARELRLLRAQQEATHGYALKPFDTTLVFGTRTGRPHDPGNIRRRVLQPACVRAGLPKLGMHDLRHTCASLLLHEGRSVVQVQKILGHHSPAFTLSRYVHLLDNDVGAALDVSPAGGMGEDQGKPSEAPGDPLDAVEELVR
jgi:integrase